MKQMNLGTELWIWLGLSAAILLLLLVWLGYAITKRLASRPPRPVKKKPIPTVINHKPTKKKSNTKKYHVEATIATKQEISPQQAVRKEKEFLKEAKPTDSVSTNTREVKIVMSANSHKGKKEDSEIDIQQVLKEATPEKRSAPAVKTYIPMKQALEEQQRAQEEKEIRERKEAEKKLKAEQAAKEQARLAKKEQEETASEIAQKKQKRKLDKLKEDAKRLEKRDASAYEKKLVEGMSFAPNDSELMVMLTDFYFQSREYKKALSLLKRILEKEKDNHKALWQMGEVYLQQGDIKTAEIMIEKAVKKSQDNPRYLYSLVDIKYNTDNIDDAIYLMDKILKLRPTNVEYLTAAAMLHEQNGDAESAKKYFFEILQTDPENRTAKKKIAQYS